MKSCGKIKFARIVADYIVTYDQQRKTIKVFDTQTKNLKHSLTEVEGQVGSVNSLAIDQTTLAYIKGRNLNVYDLNDQSLSATTLQREALLKTLEVNHELNIIATGDIYGKIYLVHISKNPKQRTVVQTLHWHS